MRSRNPFVLILLAFSAGLAACDGDNAFVPQPGPGPGPTPPPGTAAGLWVGQAVTPDVPDLVTGFEFNDPDGFTLGDDPFTAEFQGGVTQIASGPNFRTDGSFSWHIGLTDGSVTFATPGDSLSFFTRTTAAGQNASIQVLDEFGAQISSTVVTNSFEEISVDRTPGQTLIGSVVITVNTGQIVIDSFTFGYPGSASDDDIACLFAPEPTDSFACILTDTASGALVASANGTYRESGDSITGNGHWYAAPGEVLPDGSTVAPLIITDADFEDQDSLNMSLDVLGLSIEIASLYDDIFDRGAALASVVASYSTFDLFGDPSSFAIDGNGQISGQSASGCMLSGQVTVIDAAANAYTVELLANAATCGALGGDYEGLGATQDDTAMDDTFVFAVFVDGHRMIVGRATK